MFLSERLADKPFCLEVAVAAVTEDAAREVVGGREEIRFRADLAAGNDCK